MEIAVSLKGITKVFGMDGNDVWALRGVDIEVEVGQLYMIVGPSGCGKTTLLSVIAGILDQTQGSCKVFEKELNEMPTKEKTRFRGTQIGFVFQSFNLIPTLTVLENVLAPLFINQIDQGQKGIEILQKVGLQDRKDFFPKQLSLGEQQRVAIARALIHDPKLIVCDEPTSALDRETGMEIMNLLKPLIEAEKRTMIIVTHDQRILDYAHRIAKMDDGTIIQVASSQKEIYG